MENKFKITMPEQEIKPEYEEKKKRAMFSEDLGKGGILAKSFMFVYLNQPASVTEICEKMSSYYKSDFDRGSVFRALKKLTDNNILFRTQSGYVLSLNTPEQKPIHQEILKKFYHFISTIPTPFRNRYNDVNYFWMNRESEKYIEWCCKLLNFKCEKK